MNRYYTCTYCSRPIEANYAIHHGCDCEKAKALRENENDDENKKELD